MTKLEMVRSLHKQYLKKGRIPHKQREAAAKEPIEFCTVTDDTGKTFMVLRKAEADPTSKRAFVAIGIVTESGVKLTEKHIRPTWTQYQPEPEEIEDEEELETV